MPNKQEKQEQTLQLEVLEHKKQIDSAKFEIARIQSAILERQECIAEASASIPVMPDRKQERSGVMADIALGNATRDDLAAVDGKIANEAALTKTATEQVAQVISDNQATLDGLLKKLEIAQSKLVEIDSRTTKVAERYFMGIADIASAQYLSHASAMKELYLKLHGLGISINKYGGIRTINSGHALMIPKFNLSVFDGIVGFPPNEPRMIVDGNFFMYGDFFQQAANKEQEIFSYLLKD